MKLSLLAAVCMGAALVSGQSQVQTGSDPCAALGLVMLPSSTATAIQCGAPTGSTPTTGTPTTGTPYPTTGTTYPPTTGTPYNPYQQPTTYYPQPTTGQVPLQQVFAGVSYNAIINGEAAVITLTSQATVAPPTTSTFTPNKAKCAVLANNDANAAACTNAKFLLKAGTTTLAAFVPTAAACGAISISGAAVTPINTTRLLNQKKLAACTAAGFKGKA